VVVGWLTDPYPFFSSVRLLRLGRMLLVFPGMEIVMVSIYHSLYDLGIISILALLSYFVFAMLGNNLWSGILAGNCAYIDPISGAQTFVTDGVTIDNTSYSQLSIQQCAPNATVQKAAGAIEATPAFGNSCPTMPILLSNGSGVMMNTYCAMYPQNPDYGQTSYDNIGYGMLTAYVLVTTEGWSSTVSSIVVLASAVAIRSPFLSMKMYETAQTWGYLNIVGFLYSTHVILGAW
jgi:hypothetical protein